MLGREYHLALQAMEYASTFHIGKRKNGDPEFEHQVSIASFVRTLISTLDNPEETLASVFLHDVCEDYDVGFEEIEAKFGLDVKDAVVLLTKKHRGAHVDRQAYYEGIGKNRIASIVKGADRIHNIQTMQGAFSIEKQVEYIDETNNLVLPMLKSARRKFTSQESAYENIKHVLKAQVDLIAATHEANLSNEKVSRARDWARVWWG
jgi:(p)ppGpp synthase/HD superfamily hydrolase